MRVERPRRHDRIVVGLWRAAAEGRLPHALAFEGARGTGRFQAAQWLAAGLLCARGPDEPCGACGPCKRVASGGWRGNHADLHVVDAVAQRADDPTQKEQIRADQVKGAGEGATSIEGFLSLRALEGRWRVVLVREAHRMNVHAQNALLKTLEEPAEATLLLLETHLPEQLLPTVRSRCVRVRLDRLDERETAEILAAAGFDADEAARLARAARGSPGDALDLHRRGGLALRDLLAGVLAGAVEPGEASRAALAAEGEFAGASATARERDRARTVALLAVELVADAVRLAAGAPPATLAHAEALVPAAVARASRDLLEAAARVALDVEANLHPQAALERAVRLLGLGPPLSSNRDGGPRAGARPAGRALLA